MKILFSVLLLILANSVLISQNKNDDELYKKAVELAHKFMIIDTHVDVPYRLQKEWEDISQRTSGGHFDYERAKFGGLDVPFMSIYIPAEYEEKGGAKKLADSLIDIVENFQTKFPQKFAVAVSTDDVQTQFKKGLISLPMGMENGSAIEGDLKNLQHFYNRGIRYITLTHSKNNHICDSSYDKTKKWKGLSPFGEKVVAEMNRLGIMVDISHVSDDTFYDVLKITKTPVIASHSSCRHFTPGFERNMSDKMIKALAKNGGVIQINFGSGFLLEEYRSKMKIAKDYLDSKNIKGSSPEGEKYYAKYKKEKKVNLGTAKDIADHIEHVVKLVGIDHVGIGSDYDGIDDLPKGAEDVSAYPNIIYELLKLGYPDEDIQKICSGNILRVWKQIEEFAADLK
ncbi:MAG: peptidase M19 [Ignavibacteria bacterium GWB2_35_6b]|nr:MAG: peptidase M19 [Ignavibacteria bacterium GWB2_35_6b]